MACVESAQGAGRIRSAATLEDPLQAKMQRAVE
jgi:hypothetical protein